MEEPKIDSEYYFNKTMELLMDYPVLERKYYIKQDEDHIYIMVPENIVIDYKYKVVDNDIYLSDAGFMFSAYFTIPHVLKFCSEKYDNIYIDTSNSYRSKRCHRSMFLHNGMIIKNDKDMKFDKLIEKILESPQEIGPMDFGDNENHTTKEYKHFSDLTTYSFGGKEYIVKYYIDNPQTMFAFFNDNKLSALIDGNVNNDIFSVATVWQSKTALGLVRDIYTNFLLDNYAMVVSDKLLTEKGIQMWRKFLSMPNIEVGAIFNGEHIVCKERAHMNRYMEKGHEESKFYIKKK